MKTIFTLLFILSTIFLFAQPHQLEVEGNVATGIERALILEHNRNNGSNGFTSLLQYAGTGNSESLGGFITYNDNYTAIPDFNGYVSILSGSNTKLGRGINLIGSSLQSNVRFYIGGNLRSHMKMILNQNGFLGIGTTAPLTKLHIEGTEATGFERALILEHNKASGSNGLTSFLQYSGTGNSEVLGGLITYNDNYTAIPDFNGYVSILSGSNTKLGRGINLIGSSPQSNVRFYIGGNLSSNMKMILNSDGFLGIGTTAPVSKLQVSDGDIYIEDISSGIIMKSPDGNCWRLTLDNAGVLTPVALATCPN